MQYIRQIMVYFALHMFFYNAIPDNNLMQNKG